MMRQFMKPERIRIIAVLAIFNYIFLGSEYLFDNMIRYATDSAGVNQRNRIPVIPMH